MSNVFAFWSNFLYNHMSLAELLGRAWKVDGRAEALVGPGLATPLLSCNHDSLHDYTVYSYTQEVYHIEGFVVRILIL